MRSGSQSWGRAMMPMMAAIVALGCGCKGVQSALDPAGPQSERIDRLWWLMFWTCLSVFAAVMCVLVAAIWRRRWGAGAGESPEADRRITRTVAAAIVVTTIILFGLMISDFVTGRAITSLRSSDAVSIRVTGHQWWWDFEYVDSLPSRRVRTANEIHIPVGRPVQFQMTSADVIHSFWVPNLHGKTDLLTGHQTETWLQADRPGIYRGQCAEYCGHQHAHMAFVVIAEAPEQFNSWIENQRRPAPPPADSEQQKGQQIFMTRTCVMCHQIRGTDAGGRVGPELTHLASRLHLAAGTLVNNRDNLAAWVNDPQHYKPGNKMPPGGLSRDDLNALVSFLQSLK